MVQKQSYYERNKEKELEKNKLKREHYLKDKEKVLNDYKLKYPELNYLRISDYEKHEKKEKELKLDHKLLNIEHNMLKNFVKFNYDEKNKINLKDELEKEEDDNMSHDTDYFDEILDDIENDIEEKEKEIQTYQIHLKGLDDHGNINENNFIEDVINAKLCIKDNWIVINGNMMFLDSFLRLTKEIEDYVKNN